MESVVTFETRLCISRNRFARFLACLRGKEQYRKLADDNQAEQVRIDVSQPVPGKIYQKYFFIVHYFLKSKDDFSWAIIGRIMSLPRKLSNLLVIYGTILVERFSAGFFSTSFQNNLTERFFAPSQLKVAKRFYWTSLWIFPARCCPSRVVHNQQRCISEILLKHRAAGDFHIKKLIEYAQQLVDDESFLLRIIRVVFQHIKPHRPVSSSRVKVNQIFHPVFRYPA